MAVTKEPPLPLGADGELVELQRRVKRGTCNSLKAQTDSMESRFGFTWMPVWVQASLVNSIQRPSFTSHKHISLRT